MKFKTAHDRAQITSALKRSNERLASISRKMKKANASNPKYDPRNDSAIFKSIIAPFENGRYDKYLTKSSAGKKFYKTVNGERVLKNVTQGGNVKFDIRAIMKDIESGKLDYSEANDFLVKAAGLRISEDGTVTEAGSGGVSTLSEIKDEATNMFGDELAEDELLNQYDDLLEFRESFQTDYDDFKAENTLEDVDNNTIINRLKSENRSEGEYLDYEELIEIHKELRKGIAKYSEGAKNHGKAKKYGGNK